MASRTPTRAILVMVTVDSLKLGELIGRSLVSERLAACVNVVGPVRSIYRWRGSVEAGREFLLLIKTRRGSFAAVERRVRQLHSYELPEVIALRVEAGSAPYLEWIVESTRPSHRGRGAASDV